MVGDLGWTVSMTFARIAWGMRNRAASVPRKMVILDGTAAWSAPRVDRGTPWYSPYSPAAPTDRSWASVGHSSITMATLPRRSRNASGRASIASATQSSTTASSIGTSMRATVPPGRRGRPGRVLDAVHGLPWGPVSIAPNDFVHLHTHSEFSLLDGLGRISELVDTSVRQRLRLAGRHGPRACTGRSLLPGGDQGGDQADHRSRPTSPPVDDRQGGQADSQPFHLVLLDGQDGYRNLSGPDRRARGRTTTSRASREHLPVQRGPRRLSACSAARSPRRSRSTTGSWPDGAGEYGDILGKGAVLPGVPGPRIPEQRRL